MSGHTPGDWIARPDPHGSPTDFCIGLDDDCSPVDYVAVCRARDARLIASSPKLLKALQSIVALLAEHDDDGMIEHAEQMIAARAAIAEATGETP